MSRKKCKRKVWPTQVDTIAIAIDGARITDAAHLDKLRLRELAAIEAFARGRATVEDWKDLADMLNVAETMGTQGIGPEVLPVCETAQRALAEAHRRHTQLGKLGLSGPELQALRELHEYHDLQRTSVDRSQYFRSIQATQNRIRSAHPSHKVCIV